MPVQSLLSERVSGSGGGICGSHPSVTGRREKHRHHGNEIAESRVASRNLLHNAKDRICGHWSDDGEPINNQISASEDAPQLG